MIDILFKIVIVVVVLGLPTIVWFAAIHRILTGYWFPWDVK